MPYHRPSLAVVRPRRERSERPRRWPTGCPKAMGYAHAHNAKPGPQHHGTVNEMMETLAECVSNLFKLKHYGFLRCGETGFDHYFKPTKTDDINLYRHDNGDYSGINYMVAWWCIVVSNSKWFITGFISYLTTNKMYKHERPPIICRSVSLDFPIYLWYIYGLWTGYQVVNPPGTLHQPRP